MKIKFLSSLILSGALATFCGCVGTEDGRTTAGDPISKDTITSRYERPAETVAKATRAVLEHNGKMLVDNSVNNSFEAKVNERTIWVKVTDIDGKLTEVGVQARGPWGGDVELAAELSKQIALQIEANQNQNQ
jgi:hypothetical protein